MRLVLNSASAGVASYVAAHPGAAFEARFAMGEEEELLRAELVDTATGTVVASTSRAYGVAYERAVAAAVAAEAAAAEEATSFKRRQRLVTSALDDLGGEYLYGVQLLASQRATLLNELLQFTASAFTFYNWRDEPRKGEVVAKACALREAVGAVDIVHPQLGPRRPRVPPVLMHFTVEECFTQLDDLHVSCEALVRSVRKRAQQLVALKVSVEAAVRPTGELTDGERAWLRSSKDEFRDAVAGIAVGVIE